VEAKKDEKQYLMALRQQQKTGETEAESRLTGAIDMKQQKEVMRPNRRLVSSNR
jgi:hypothetical protein